MKIIKFKLSEDSINKLISKIDKMQAECEYALQEAVSQEAIEAVNIVYQLTPVDTGESRDGIDYELTENKLVITQRGDHVFENEFGDGVGFGTYPDASLIPPDMPTHKGVYRYKPTNPNSKYYEEVDTIFGKQVKTKRASGQKASAQMYGGAMHLREKLPETIKQKVRGALSKI